MKKCVYCGHIELSKQEIKIYRLLSNFKTSIDIAMYLKTKRKIILQVLYKLEKNNFIERKNNTRPIVWEQQKRCCNCVNFKWLSAFNTYSCKESEGIHWYCNNYIQILDI